MHRVVIRFSICVFPLALTPLWGYLIADGYLDFGGGEKDLLLLIPWIIWSLLYLIIFVGSWLKRLPIKKTLAYSAGGASFTLVLVWLVMFVWFSGMLGIS